MSSKHVRACALALLALLSLSALPARAAEIVGRVVGVSDGDTLTLLTPDKRQVKVRLAEIDTPESRQPYGTRSKQALSDLAFGREARIVVQDTDRYGRTVGRVFVGSTDVNATLVEQGAAWVYRQYSRDPRLLALEAQAQQARRGLWALPEAERMPPWEWRRAAKSGEAPRATPAAPAATAAAATGLSARGGSGCAGKRRCAQMADCAEARHYLDDCGVRTLDGDGDGTPCESLCR